MKSHNYFSSQTPLRVVLNRIGETDLAQHAFAKAVLRSSKVVHEFYREVIAVDPSFEADKENLIVILLNTRLRPLGYNTVSVGSLNETIASPREIFRPVIVGGAFGFILIHNHPSGDPTPSESDRRMTRKILEASSLLDIRLVDHLIVGDSHATDGAQPYFSFKEAGLI